MEEKRKGTIKLTDELFDDVIGHIEYESKYFTIENNNIIYRRLKKETDLEYLPYLGACIDYGEGDVCIEEGIKDGVEIFKFYIIDRFNKFDYQEFSNLEDAINRLVEYYINNEMTKEPEKVKSIFIETLGLQKSKNLSLNKESKN